MRSAAAFPGHVAAEVVDVRLLAMDDHHKSIAAVIGRESKGAVMGREREQVRSWVARAKVRSFVVRAKVGTWVVRARYNCCLPVAAA